MSFHKSFVTAGTDTSDATALQHHIKSGKTAYIASGKVTGNAYTPAMMKFDGSTGYYTDTHTSSGNKVTVIGRIKIPTFVNATSSQRYIARCQPSAGIRFGIYVRPSDYATADHQGRLVCFTTNTAAATVCLLISVSSVIDDEFYTFMYSYDGDAGTASLIINGFNADNPSASGRTLSTGTLGTTTPTTTLGATFGGGAYLQGNVGFFGHRDAYLTNWQDFMQNDGSPKPLDESTWAEWGAQPLFWHESGKMDENKGSAGNMTKNGSIILAPASSWS